MRKISIQEKQKAVSDIKSGLASTREVAFRLGLPEVLVKAWAANSPIGSEPAKAYSNPRKSANRDYSANFDSFLEQVDEGQPSNGRKRTYIDKLRREFAKNVKRTVSISEFLRSHKETVKITSGICLLLLMVLVLLSLDSNQQGSQNEVGVTNSPDRDPEPELVSEQEPEMEPESEPESEPEPEPSLDLGKRVYDKAINSIALVRTLEGGQGTAVYVEQDRGLLITAFHVIEGHRNVQISFPVFSNSMVAISDVSEHYRRARWISAKVIRENSKNDLAVLQLESRPREAVPIVVSDSSVSPGQDVFTLGNPTTSMGLWIFSAGAVRQVFNKYKIRYPGQQVECKVVQTQNPTNPGDSGGALLNGNGELVGINSGKTSEGELVSISIDIQEVNTMLDAVLRE